jgi:hypothetical protein
MRLAIFLLLIAPSIYGQTVTLPGPGPIHVTVSGGTPTLAQFKGTSGEDIAAAVVGANKQLWNFDTVGPRVLTSGSLLIWSGEWPNSTTTGAGYHQNCTAPCSPAPTDNNSNALTAVFTVGTACKDSSLFDHNIWYEQNIPSGTTFIQDNFPNLISNNVFDSGVFYNVATSGGIDGSNCTLNVTPANNTAPNISGTGFTVTVGDLVWVEIDDQSLQTTNTPTSITVPSGCSLGSDQRTPTNNHGIAHWTLYCIAASTTFTPQFTVAQTTHDTFTIMAAAFKSGAGGTAPAAGPGVLYIEQSIMQANGQNSTINVGCPTGTAGVFISDDAGEISSVTDSNSNTFSSAAFAGAGTITYYAGVSGTALVTTGIPNSYTITLHFTAGGGFDIPTIFCTNTSHLDTGFVIGTGSTQVTTSTVANQISTSTGAGNCQGTAGTLVTCTGLPIGTPGRSAGELFIGTCSAGHGPFLQTSAPAGYIMDSPVPAAVANIFAGDLGGYNNGDAVSHFYQASTSQISFNWKAQQNASAESCQVTATF